MENHTFIRVNLSDVRVIMVIMRVLIMEFPCHVVTGQIPTLESISECMFA
jgi:hypothetical protein